MNMNIPDVALADEDTSVVDGLGETELVDTGLATALQEILNFQGQDVIELHAGLVEHTNTDETANEGISFEETLGVLLVEGKELTVGKSQRTIPPRHHEESRWRGGKGEGRPKKIHTGQHDESWTG